MKCFEVSINGKKVCVAGTDLANRLAIRIHRVPKNEVPWVHVSRDTYGEDNTWKEKLIFGEQELADGDAVTVRVVESNEPDAPIETREINYSRPSEELTDKIVEMTAKLWLGRLLTGKPIPINKEEVEAEERETTPQCYSCSFCEKRSDEIKKLIAGPGVYICNECVDLCVKIIHEQPAPENGKDRFYRPKARWPLIDNDGETPSAGADG